MINNKQVHKQSGLVTGGPGLACMHASSLRPHKFVDQILKLRYSRIQKMVFCAWKKIK